MKILNFYKGLKFLRDKKEIINLKGKSHKEINKTLGKISREINAIFKSKNKSKK